MGKVGPNNTMVELGNSFQLQCMSHDFWTTYGNYWYIYFSITSIVCRVYAASDSNAKSASVCSKPYDMGRFSAHREEYVLKLDVKEATVTDAGLYVCAQPPVHHPMGELGLVAVVGVVCKLTGYSRSHVKPFLKF